MSPRLLAFLALLLAARPAPADIFRWDNGQLIPGTEGITPGPAVDLSQWNVESRNLRFADFAEQDLSRVSFSESWLDNARFTNANLARARLTSADLSNANLSRANLTSASLTGANLTDADLQAADLTDAFFAGTAILTRANLRDAVVKGAFLEATTGRGFTKEQLYSTASYHVKDLGSILLSHNDLSGWNFAGQNLRGARFNLSNLDNADFRGATLSNVIFDRAELGNANLSNANLSHAYLSLATLARANLTDAEIGGAILSAMTSRGFTADQLYSTDSYRIKNLAGINLADNDLSGWAFQSQGLSEAVFSRTTLIGANVSRANLTSAKFDYAKLNHANLAEANLSKAIVTYADLSNANLRDANLTGAAFAGAALTDADMTDAVINNASFGPGTRDFTKAQLYSTASYNGKDLSGVWLWDLDATEWNLSGQNLTGTQFRNVNLTSADLSNSILTDAVLGGSLVNANFAAAVVKGTYFGNATSRGLTREQLYSTASYQAKDLGAVKLYGSDLSGWDLSGQNLTGASFRSATISGANLAGSIVKGAEFFDSPGFTTELLYSTLSYQMKDLSDILIRLDGNSNWELSGQNLTGARLWVETSARIDLSRANLTNGGISGTDVSSVYFTDAIVKGAGFSSSLTQQQLYSTASYKAKNLGAIKLYPVGMSGWNFEGQNMAFAFLGDVAGANFRGANLVRASISYPMVTGADFSLADTRGTQNLYVPTNAIIRNTILWDGSIRGLDLSIGEVLVIRDYDTIQLIYDSVRPVRVNDRFASNGRLTLLFEEDDWGSIVFFQPGIPVALGGELELAFAAGVDPATQIGRTFDLFDWTGVSPTGTFNVVSDYAWDTSQLYTTGEVTLIPEPASLPLLLAAAALLGLAARRHARTSRRRR